MGTGGNKGKMKVRTSNRKVPERKERRRLGLVTEKSRRERKDEG